VTEHQDSSPDSRTNVSEEGRFDRRSFLAKSGVAVGAASVGTSIFGASSSMAKLGSVRANPNMTTSQLAVAIAKKYAGKTINWQVEAGTQSALWVSIQKLWESETGTKLNVLATPYAEQFPKAVAAHQAGSGIDGLYVQYNWLPDFSAGQVIAPIDSYLKKYFTTPKLKAELADFVQSIMIEHTYWNGQRYGYPIDGPGFYLYYRSDILSDKTLAAGFKKKYGYAFGVPKTWAQYRDVGSYITEKLGPKVYGATHMGIPAEAQFPFMQVYNNAAYGDQKYFDANMKATINNAPAVKAVKELTSYFDFAPPGAKGWGPIEAWSLFLKGGLAMTVTWPPLFRLAEGYGAHSPLLNFVPPSKVVGKVASAIPPGGNMQDASGYSMGVFNTSDVKELVFAFITWATAPDVQIRLLSNVNSFCRPVRTSTFNNPKMHRLFPGAGPYYTTMLAGLKHVTSDLTILQSQQYLTALGAGVNAAFTGTDAKKALDTVAGQWDQFTNTIGVKAQKQAYATYQKNVALFKKA
jgi:multiple sugar transport system substrate-binding protein